MKLTIYTKNKKWEFDHDQSDWVISDNWVEVRTAQNKTFIFPIHSVNLLIITFPRSQEKMQVFQQQKEGQQK
jgi:hypothetical protein